jgi:SAM-dependent methyltransferase
LHGQFRNAYLWTTAGDWQLTQAGAPAARLVRHKTAVAKTPARAHDQSGPARLDATAQDWLHGLGITTAQGDVAAGMADKHRQVNHYLEILSHLAKDCGWSATGSEQCLTIADMGCGKGYLTFGAWHLLRRVGKLSVRVLGVEQRPELVESSNRLARQIGAADLEFIAGTISDAALPERLDALIALHACDTATDDAIRRGIAAGARLIVVAPCCQKELRPQLGSPAPLDAVLRHGLMAGRMADWLTDGLRALFLEWAGYETKVFEFVASGHTPKNLMISAVRRAPPFTETAAREKIIALKSFFGIQHHALDELLNHSDADAHAPGKP